MILRSLKEIRATSDRPVLPLSDAFRGTWLWEALGGGSTDGVVAVNERSSMGIPAVWTCVNIISTAIASLPWKVYEKQKPGRRVASELREYRILHDAPSEEDTSFTFRHKMVGNMLLWGNAYAEKVYDGANRLSALYHHYACNVRVELGNRRGNYRYIVTTSDGERAVQREDMLHFRGFAYDGIVGVSVIQQLRRTMGLNISAEVFAQNFYNNGARPSGVLMYPGKLSDKARENLLSSFDEKSGGLSNVAKTILTEEGIKYQPLSIPQNDAQFIETRQLGSAQVAGAFQVPVMLVPDATKSTPTFASSETFMRGFVDFCLRGHITNIENEVNVKCFSDDPDYYNEFDLRGLLRGNSTERAQLHKAMWEVGAKSANDINDDEGENPVPGGDRYYIPANNYTPVDRVDDVIDAQIKPKSEPAPATMNKGSGEGDRSVRPSYKRMLWAYINEVQGWKQYQEDKAAQRFLNSVLRPIADDIRPLVDEKFLEGYAVSLAKRAKSLNGDSIEAELKRAIAEISAHGGNDVQD
jgi:HK97 family phage portal protein